MATGQAVALDNCDKLSKQSNIQLCVVVDKEGEPLPRGVHAHGQDSWWRQLIKFVGYFIQCLSTKLGVATGMHLAEHCRLEYPRYKRITLWAIGELGIITCDMVEVIGGAVAFQTLTNGAIPLYAGVILVVATTFCALYLERIGMRALEAVFFALLGTMAGTFGFLFFTAGVDYGQVAKGLVVPRMDSDNISFAVGAMGAMLMPYNLYLQSDLMDKTTRPRALRFFKIESAAALLVSLMINIFIISVFACGFEGNNSVGLGNAGRMLGDLFGRHMQYIWGVGLLAASHAASITSTFAGQLLMDGYFGIKVSVWWRTALVRAVTLGPTLLVAIVLGKQNDSFEGFTEWLNVSQSLVLPFVVIPLLVMTSTSRIMGDFVNSKWHTGIMSVIIVFLLGMNGYLAVTFSTDKLPDYVYAKALFWIAAAIYCFLIVYLCITPQR
ncbi:hypothetical protein N2152v2_002613 [Parachlorella kessleri]